MKKISWAFGVMAFGLLGLAAWQFQDSRQRAAHWQPTEATVSNGRIVKEWVDNPDRKRDGERYVLKYFAEFQLDYSYNGYRFHAWQRGALGSVNRSTSEAVLGSFSNASKHKIWVNPEAPEEMAFAVSGAEAYLFSIICASVGSLFGLLTLAVLLWPKRPASQSVLRLELSESFSGVAAPIDGYLRQKTQQHQGDQDQR